MFRKKYGSRRYKKVRYSNETSSFAISQQLAQDAITQFPSYAGNVVGKTLVAATNIQGTRKVKNMSLSISNTTGCTVPILCALVYVPQGTKPSPIQPNATDTSAPSSLYEPNQNVIMQFVLNPVNSQSGSGSNVMRFKTRLARNLDSGDSIVLVMAPALAPTAAQNVNLAGTLNYAISY